MELKYVILKVDAMETPVLFPAFLQHIGVSEGILARERDAFRAVSVVAAGFCHIDAVAVRVWGYSEGLGIGSRPADAEVIHRALFPLSARMCAQTDEKIVPFQPA